MKISIIGSGGWGTAISVLLANNGHDVTLWSWQEEESKRLCESRENKEFLPGIRLLDNINCTWDLKSACQDKDLIVSALPSFAIRATAKKMRPYIKEGQVLLNVSKGLEPGTQKRISEIFAEEVPQAQFAVMSGPSHAEEVGRGVPSANVVASGSLEVAQLVQDAFMSPSFRVYINMDMAGVELGGSLKNIIALCAGIVDGLGFGDNTKAALMTRGLVEIIRLGKAIGAKEATFNGLSGVGDLIVTCTSMHSRNRRAGILIGQGKSLDETLEAVHMTVEGVVTTKAAYEMAQKCGVEMPIVNKLYEVLYEGKSPREAVISLMVRDKKHEFEEI